MKNTKKIRLVIEGFVPEDFPIKNLTTSGRYGSAAEWCPLYVHAGVGEEYGADYTSVLEGHMTMSAEVVVPPEPEYKAAGTWHARAIAPLVEAYMAAADALNVLADASADLSFRMGEADEAGDRR